MQVFGLTDGVEDQTKDKLPTAQACADAVYALPPNVDGALPDGVTWNKLTQECHAEYGQTSQFVSRDYQNCAFKPVNPKYEAQFIPNYSVKHEGSRCSTTTGA